VPEAEAEQLVAAAYRAATNEPLPSRREVFARANEEFPPAAAHALETMVARRAAGELLQHVTGFQQFLGHAYETGPSALVPRPETELLASEAIAALSGPALGLEIGVGTGVLSIELLQAFPGLRMVASELSSKASALASRNAQAILRDPARLELRAARGARDVWGPFAGLTPADFLISNPPYLLRSGEAEDDVARQEPGEALYAPEGDPLFFYREIAAGARHALTARGKVFVELAHERALETKAVFEGQGWRVELVDDLNGRPRVLVAER
jgi:release factor glutamine methyltransferase